MIEYLIIGSGIAGISFAETCIQNGKSFFVLENNSQNSSYVAGGLYNPVILKRFSKVEGAQEQLALLNSFYGSIEERIHAKVNFPLPILRKFFSIEEQNNWFIASDKIGLSPFLSTDLLFKQYEGIDAPYGYGEVLQTGYLDTTVLLDGYRNYLKENGLIGYETFEYDQLAITPDFIQYKDIKARHIVFAEGFGMHANPYFRHLPLDGTKGELFIIKAPGLKIDVIVNTSVFILPLGNDLFKVGATYNWADKTDLPTEEGKQELVSRIKEILNCEFEIVKHFGGVRPTVKDRKPLVGTHPDYANVHILNGLGTRGVMLGPAMAQVLYENIENGVPLDRSCDIKRFDKKK
ncbi:NAD(P)/FAD-dependent oxidoreductase [Flavobacterium sp. PLA-1-15]|uniref:NAD(P)/FAD-dependent oxidoreductase n=1 Tax=Flavobacterium sp. PLA-1-15 TaxID=3380533 RepID=UPI003B7BCE1B